MDWKLYLVSLFWTKWKSRNLEELSNFECVRHPELSRQYYMGLKNEVASVHYTILYDTIHSKP
jgi:hypothetical protein